jgi:hypothetical protein
MALNLNFRGMGSEEHKSAFEESQAAAGDSLTLLLELPDGRVLEESVSNMQFKQGNDIDWVIFQVSRKTEIDQQSIVNLTQELYHEGQKLLGPLALADYPQIRDRTLVKVQVKDS